MDKYSGSADNVGWEIHGSTPLNGLDLGQTQAVIILSVVHVFKCDYNGRIWLRLVLDKLKTNNMKNIEYILNDCLNKAMCQRGRIQHPNSNNIADFVAKYILKEKLTELLKEAKEAFAIPSVVQQSEQFKCDNGCDWYRVGHQLNGHQQCRKCGKQKAF